jgi:hypothetical protein
MVKVTHALVRDLDEIIKEVKLLGKNGVEASQKVTELEALCKRLREYTQKRREEKTKLEGMVESRDELIMEIADEIGLNHMGEDAKVEEEDEDKDDDDGGDAAAPTAATPSPIPLPPAAAHGVTVVEEEDPVEMVSKQQGLVAHEVILADVEPELLQPCFYNFLLRDYEESPSRIMDDPDELDDPTEADYDVDEWYPEDGSSDRD